MTAATVVLVPGLRGTVEDHWQTRLAATLPDARCVPPLGRTEPGLRARATPRALARAWGSRWHSLGAVGHLNPGSGLGDRPEAAELIRDLAVGDVQAAPDAAPLHRLQRESA